MAGPESNEPEPEAALSTTPHGTDCIGSAHLENGWPIRLLLFIATAIVAHQLLSRLGFNPTDDGFILAQSRRILEGQVPHRDFISIRPAGSAILHTVELVLGGPHTFLLSRFFYWLQAAAICWCWMEIALCRSPSRPSLTALTPLIPLAFMLTTHAFPPMAWHTVDGVCLASLGLLACTMSSQRWRLAGYVLIGAAVTCKQNFFPLLPLAVVAHGDLRRPVAWLAVTAPALLYVAMLSGLDAARDMQQQLFAFTELTGPGVKHYLGALGWPTGLIIGVFAGFLATRQDRRAIGPWLGFLVLVIAIGSIGSTLDAEQFFYIDFMSFVLMGGLCGFLLASLRKAGPSLWVRSAALLAVLSWCSSVSHGYQTPAHLAGPLATFLLVSGGAALIGSHGMRSRIAAAALLWIVTIVVSRHWWSARTDHIYNEATAPMLRNDLDGVIAGASGIATNANTFVVLSDLHDLVQRLNGRSYAIVVDCAGWWACAKQPNPLKSDWPQTIELCNQQLQDRYSAHAVEQRGKTVFIVQKIQMVTLSEGLYELGDLNPYYGAAVWIRRSFNKVEETRFWAVFE